MRALLLTLLAAGITFFSAAQTNDLKRMKLKGNVKALTEYEYTAVTESKDVAKGELRWKGVTDFDAAGNIAAFSTYAADNSMLSRSVYTYNDSGRLLDVKRYRADGGLNVKVIYKCDANGNQVEEENFDASGTMFMSGKGKFVNGNRIVYDRYNQFGHLFLKSNIKFDRKGNEIEEREYDSHQGLKFTTTFMYDAYDANGNWLRKITFKNDEAKTVTEREITYK
ncbi:MAG: hypothetical protein V4649_17060 [Bacteroidota bacterium]